MSSFALVDARGECLALTGSRDEMLDFIPAGHEWLGEAARCGHPLAPAWVEERLPLTVRIVSAEERDEILEDGTPALQREP